MILRKIVCFLINHPERREHNSLICFQVDKDDSNKKQQVD